jgi:hypothetical protein
MPKGEEFSIEAKKLMFRVIDFVESERDGLQIPLKSTSARVMALLGIGYSSVHRLKSELEQLRRDHREDKIEVEKIPVAEITPPRTRTQSATVHAPSGLRKIKKTWSARRLAVAASFEIEISPLPPQKKGNVGRRRVVLTEACDDAIRYHFHLILVSIYFCFYCSHFITLI